MLRVAVGHALGGALGGTAGLGTVGAVLGVALARVPLPLGIVTSLGMSVVAAIGDLAILRLPRNDRQVRGHWVRAMPPWRAYLGYGFVMGTGLLSLLPYYGALAVVAVSASIGPVVALAAGAAIGLGRGLSLWPLALLARHVGGLARQYGEWHRFARRVSAAATLPLVLLAVGAG